MQEKKPGLFDQIFIETKNLKLTRRKAGEAMRRVSNWLNKEMSQPEPLPPEFKEFQTRSSYERVRDSWQRHF